MSESGGAMLTSELTETEQRNLRAVSDVLPLWNSADIPGILAHYDDEITWHNIGMDEVYRGKNEVRAFFQRLYTAFPDLQLRVTHKIARGNNVAEQWEVEATHRGIFMGIPPTGRRIHYRGMSMIEMRDGKFLSDHFYYDAATVMRQLRLLPPLSLGESPVGRGSLWLAVSAAKAVDAARTRLRRR